MSRADNVIFPDPDKPRDWVLARVLPNTRNRYAVTRDGRVFKQRRKSGAWRKKGMTPQGGGYLQTAIDGRLLYVSHLVCRAWHAEPPSADAVAMHRDNDRTNNAVGNLKWGSQHDNVRQAVREGRHVAATRPAIPRATRAKIGKRTDDWLH